MIFKGWVAIQRSILEDARAGKLSPNELAVLLCLTLLADKDTGMGHINGPVLRTYFPSLTVDHAKRILISLERKKYIWRKIIRRSVYIYPYWLNAYTMYSEGHKSLQTDLTKVFESKDISDIRYVTPALQGAPQSALQGAPRSALQGAHYNNKDNKKDKNNDKDNTIRIVPVGSSDAKNDTGTSPGNSSELSPECINTEAKEHSDRKKESYNVKGVEASLMQTSIATITPKDCGAFIDGQEVCRDLKTGRAMTETEIRNRMLAVRDERRVKQVG
jgi:hypothetical protein